MRQRNVRQGTSGQATSGTSCRGIVVPFDGGDEVVRLRGLAAFLQLAQEAEGRRISRELHDDLGQKLALLEIQVERMKRAPASEDHLALELESLRGNLAGLAEDLHRVCHRLHPVILDNLGLCAGIESLCEEYTKMSGIAVTFVPMDVPLASSGISLCFYRVVQEALHNVAKHSRAKRANVMLRGSGDGIQVIIRDAGCGFDPILSRMGRAAARNGLGLISISERVRLLGGWCEIRSSPGRGTRIVAFVPLPPGAAEGSKFQLG